MTRKEMEGIPGTPTFWEVWDPEAEGWEVPIPKSMGAWKWSGDSGWWFHFRSDYITGNPEDYRFLKEAEGLFGGLRTRRESGRLCCSKFGALLRICGWTDKGDGNWEQGDGVGVQICGCMNRCGKHPGVPIAICLYVTDPEKRPQMDKVHQEIHRRILLIRNTDQPKKGEGGYWGKPAQPIPPAETEGTERPTPARLHQDNENWIVLQPWQHHARLVALGPLLAVLFVPEKFFDKCWLAGGEDLG